MTSRDLWLIRSAQNLVTGPHTREEVIAQIQSLKLLLSHEFCPANGYWFFLHETEEVKKVLGIEVPQTLLTGDGEKTHTDTQTATLPDVPRPAEPKGLAVTDEFGSPIIEKAAVWRFAVWFLVLAIGLVLAVVLRLLTGVHK